jgi:hypothetical protein
MKAFFAIALGLSCARAVEPSVPFRIQLDTLAQDYDGKRCWVQARAGAIPRAGMAPLVVVTMQKLLLTGSDVYFAVNDLRSEDLGKTWSGPVEHAETMGRRSEGEGVEAGPGDLTPKWHAASGKLLITGSTMRYRDAKGPIKNAPRQVVYSSYDPTAREWARWATLEMPPGELSYACGAGCTQRFDLPNGDILLPVYFKEEAAAFTCVKVLRCRFDGKKLTLVASGNDLRLDTKRGLAEPSLTRFRDRYLLTIRHDDAGYVSGSADGLHFGEMQKWCWDDGTELGTYNTQTHWVTHSDALFLAYTRRGANNDHVFRHRAPLFIAEVDPATLRVIRATERVLIPEKGARYGNFGVCEVSESETWVVETEWMQRPPAEPIIPVENQWGAAGRVYAARILWEKPDRDWNQR